jgi:Kef-type K+ transport system membrane component KefB
VIARGGALLLLFGLMLLVQAAVPPSSVTGLRTAGLALGFAMVAATLLGDLAERARLPRLSGYLLFGLLCGPYVANLLTPVMARQLQLVNGLAIVLIALIAGLEINFQRIRPRLVPLVTFGGLTIVVMFSGLLVMFAAIWPWLPFAPEATGFERIAYATVVTTLVVSFSPTVTIAVIAESRARGPLAELVLAVVVIGDLALILLFTLAMQFAHTTSDAGAVEDVGLLIRLLWEVVGSVSFGALLGAIFALYLRFIGREITVVLVGFCLLIAGAASYFDSEALLVALAAGIVIENIAPPRGDALRDAVERAALPILVIFFVAAGASLNLGALAEIGLLAVSVAVVRVGWIRLGTYLGQRSTSLGSEGGRAWMGLVSQAGVTLGLTTIVASEFPGWGTSVQTLLVAMIALHGLAGPMLFRSALSHAGEIGRLDDTAAEPGLLVASPSDHLSMTR